jgi:ubiquitin C-terminal hydrolase
MHFILFFLSLEPLIQIVIDSVANREDESTTANTTTSTTTNSDMVDATLDALTVLKLLLTSKDVSLVALDDIMKKEHLLKTLLGDVQLNHPSNRVREATSLFVRALSSASQTSNNNNHQKIIFHIMFQYIMNDVELSNDGCVTYFRVLIDLLPSTLKIYENNKDEISSKLLNVIFLSLEKCSKKKKKNKESNYLIGTLSLMSSLLQNVNTSVIEQHDKLKGFLEMVYNDYLYSVPTLQNKDAWPLCRGIKEREAAFSVLHQLVTTTSNSDNMKKMVNLISSFRKTVNVDKVGWRVLPKSIRRQTRFAGLNNQGCTCYQNATLQQLYLIKDIREGVLNAPLSPLIANKERVLLDFTPMIVAATGSGGNVVMSPSPIAEVVVVGDENINMPIAPSVTPTVIAAETKTNTNDPMNLIKKKVEIQWESTNWYTGTVQLYDPIGRKYKIQYDDGETVHLDPLKGRPTKEKALQIAIVQNEMNEIEAAQNVLEQTRRVFRFLKDSQKSAYNPKGFVESCHALKMEFGPYQQNDSSEFLQLLLDRIETGLKSNPNVSRKHSRWMSVIKGETVKMMNYDCNDFGNHSKVRASETCFVQLTVTNGMKNIYRALEEYTKKEVMEGDNKLECETCKTLMEERGMKEEIDAKAYKRKTSIRDCFSKLPNILVVSFRRFELDYETFETVKRNDIMEFPQILNVEKYTHDHFKKHQKAKDAPDTNSNTNLHQTSTTNAVEANVAEEETKGGETKSSGGATTNAAAAVPREKEVERGDPKYDYQLCGVVIHAGVAGGGHYWSLGRTTENVVENKDKVEGDDASSTKPAAAEWYKFDDDRVTPFSEDQLPNECFGGTEKYTPSNTNNYYQGSTMEREKSTNAVLIFYERVQRTPCKEDEYDECDEIKKETKENNKDDRNSGSQKDLSEIEVWDDNEKHIRIQHLFDSNYSTFLLNTLSSTSKRKNNHEFLSTCLSHFIDVVLKSADQSNWQAWKKVLIKLLRKNIYTCQWFLSQLSGESTTTNESKTTWLYDYLMKSPEAFLATRSIFSDLVCTCITVVNNSNDCIENKQINTAVELSKLKMTNSIETDSQKENEMLKYVSTSTILAVMNDLIDIVTISYKKWNIAFTTLFHLLINIVENNSNILQLLRNKSLVSILINIYLNEGSTESLKKCYGHIHYLGNQYISPNYNYMLNMITILLGVSSPRPKLLHSIFTPTGEDEEDTITMTPRSKKAFSYMYHLITHARGTMENPVVMTRQEFIQHCYKCANSPNGQPANIDMSKIDQVLKTYGVNRNTSNTNSSGSSGMGMRQGSTDSLDSLNSNDSLDAMYPSPPTTPTRGNVASSPTDYKEGVMNIDGFLQFYIDSCQEGEEKIQNALSDLSNYCILADLSYPGSTNDEENENSSSTTTSEEPINLPTLCQEAVQSQQFISRMLVNAPSNISSILIQRCITKSPYLVTQLLIPLIVRYSQEQDNFAETSLSNNEERTATFINRCLDILVPVLDNSSKTTTNRVPLKEESFDDESDDGLVASPLEIDLAEGFLFGYKDSKTITEFNTNPNNMVDKALIDSGIINCSKAFGETLYKNANGKINNGKVTWVLINLVYHLYLYGKKSIVVVVVVVLFL